MTKHVMVRYVFGNKTTGYGVGLKNSIGDCVEYEPEPDTPKWVAKLIAEIHNAAPADLDWDGCSAEMGKRGIVYCGGEWVKTKSHRRLTVR